MKKIKYELQLKEQQNNKLINKIKKAKNSKKHSCESELFNFSTLNAFNTGYL
jgi:hypothetical protein